MSVTCSAVISIGRTTWYRKVLNLTGYSFLWVFVHNWLFPGVKPVLVLRIETVWK